MNSQKLASLALVTAITFAALVDAYAAAGLLSARKLSTRDLNGGLFVAPSTSYANAGGTGARTGSITVTSNMTAQSGTWSNQVNGGYALNGTDSTDDPLATTITAGDYIQFDFGSGAKKYIDEIRIYTGTAGSKGTWKWQGSDNGSSFTDIGAASSWTSGSPQTITTGAATQYYRYFRWTAVSGGTWPNAWINEFEFKIN